MVVSLTCASRVHRAVIARRGGRGDWRGRRRIEWSTANDNDDTTHSTDRTTTGPVNDTTKTLLQPAKLTQYG